MITFVEVMGKDDSCKVDTITEKYGLDEAEMQYPTVDDHLHARWTGEGSHQAAGYRTVTEWFNKRLLQRVYDEHGRNSSTSQLDSDYEILTSDDMLQRQDLKEGLRADGINADELTENFVSWGTIRNHLKECLDGEKSIPEAETNWEERSVEIAVDTTEKKAKQAIKSLASKNELDRGDAASISVQVLLSCPDCHTRVPFEEARERGYICQDHRG